MSAKQFDVIISGGGLSGLLTAIGLQNESPELSIAIIEPVQPDQQSEQSANEAIQSNFDQRCLALSHGTLQLLHHWQVLPKLKELTWPIKTIVTSDRGHIGKTIMRANDYDVSAMGQVVSMHNLGVALKATLSSKNITWFCPDTIQSVEHPVAASALGNSDLDNSALETNSNVKIILTSGTTLTGKLLVVAEGGNSPTRQLLNIVSETSHYEQAAVIANVKVAKPPKSLDLIADSNKHVAFERFTTSGPIAFLPIGDNEFNVVWTQSPQEALRTHALPDDQFIAELQTAFSFSAGKITKCSKRAHYPLALTQVERLTAPRTVLLGNSAHTIHPIAGQGFNLGVRDIGVLVFALKQAQATRTAQSEKTDIGSFEILNAYQNHRQEDINRITSFTDSLVRIFALPGRLPALARTTGLMSLQSCDNLQQWLALHFMGSHNLINSVENHDHN